MRIHAGPLRAVVESEAALLERSGQIPRSPDILGNKLLTELLADGTLVVDIDGKYPQALGISTIIARVSVFGNSQWEVLRNQVTDSPFFTSDYPVALETHGNTGQVNWIVPLAPDLAVRIMPDERLRGMAPDLSFRRFTFRDRRIGRTEAMTINRLPVRSAEDGVFYRDQLDWIPRFIEKNRAYRIESVTARVPSGTGFLNIASQMIVQQSFSGGA
ncbi:DUF4238 domain-containing protein [Tardiphaga sp. P9-11]|nr:DUF4238 domain-containing protein [Tardiphaga sp. P9-11]